MRKVCLLIVGVSVFFISESFNVQAGRNEVHAIKS